MVLLYRRRTVRLDLDELFLAFDEEAFPVDRLTTREE
jgi:hypothetical protein